MRHPLVVSLTTLSPADVGSHLRTTVGNRHRPTRVSEASIGTVATT